MTVRKRLLASLMALLVLPIGFVPAYLIATGVRTNCHAADGTPVDPGGPGCPAPMAYQLTHPTPWWGFNHVFGPLVLLVLVAVPVLVVAILELRLLRPKP